MSAIETGAYNNGMPNGCVACAVRGRRQRWGAGDGIGRRAQAGTRGRLGSRRGPRKPRARNAGHARHRAACRRRAGTRGRLTPGQAGTRSRPTPGQAGTRSRPTPGQAGTRSRLTPGQAGTRSHPTPEPAGTRSRLTLDRAATRSRLTAPRVSSGSRRTPGRAAIRNRPTPPRATTRDRFRPPRVRTSGGRAARALSRARSTVHRPIQVTSSLAGPSGLVHRSALFEHRCAVAGKPSCGPCRKRRSVPVRRRQSARGGAPGPTVLSGHGMRHRNVAVQIQRPDRFELVRFRQRSLFQRRVNSGSAPGCADMGPAARLRGGDGRIRRHSTIRQRGYALAGPVVPMHQEVQGVGSTAAPAGAGVSAKISVGGRLAGRRPVSRALHRRGSASGRRR